MCCAALLLVQDAAAAKIESVPEGPQYAHTVRQGDTLIGIADALLVRPADWPGLQKINRIANPRRLVPGSTISIPVAWLKEETARGEVVAVAGNVTGADGQRLSPGRALEPGSIVRTGRDGFVMLRTPDGADMVLAPSSEAQVNRLSRYVNTEYFSTVMRMVSGRIEATVRKLGGPSRFEVQSEFAVAGVRGTRFRVGADAAGKRGQLEVLEGEVGFAGAAQGTQTVAVAAGFGSATDASGRALPPVPLLAAPAILAADLMQERLVTRFRFPALSGAVRYLASVANDEQLRQIIEEASFDTPEIKFANLADGEYFLRARAVDALGIEGRDVVVRFRLKARPEPPLTSAPAPGGKLRSTTADFSWAANPDAAQYRIQIAEDEAFSRVVQEAAPTDTGFTSKTLPFGEYHWRVRSVRGTTDLGPWGDPRRFSLRPPPRTPEPPEESGDGLVFNWSGEPGQTFLFQVATDPQFVRVLVERTSNETRMTLARPDQGTYFLRLRATDADGFVGPFTAPQRFTVINRVIDGGGANLSTGDGSPVRLQ